MPACVIFDKRPLEYSFQDSTSVSQNTATYSFAGRAFGAADADRKILVAIRAIANASLPTGVTIGGVAATHLNGTASGNIVVDYWWAAVPTGTTGTVAVTFSSGSSRDVAIAIYRVIPEINLVDSDTQSVGGGSPPITLNTSLDVPATGIIFGAAGETGTGDNTWTELTEDADFVTAGSFKFSCASKQYQSAQTGQAVSVTLSAGITVSSAFVVLGP